MSYTYSPNPAPLREDMESLKAWAYRELLEVSHNLIYRSDLYKVDVPATASSTGKVGQFALDSTHFYICVATDTWRRVAISTW